MAMESHSTSTMEGYVAKDPDPELVGRLKAGHEDAWTTVVCTYLPGMTAWVHPRCQRAGLGGLVDDVVQSTLIAARRSIHRFSPERKLGPWLHVILRNTFLSLVLKEKRRGNVEARFMRLQASFTDRSHGSSDFSADDYPDGEYEDRICAAKKYLLSCKLTRREFQVISGLLDQRSTREIARDLGATHSSVLMAKSRGLRKIKQANDVVGHRPRRGVA